MKATRTTQPPYDFSEQVGHLLRRAYQRHVAIFQQTIPDSRLTGAQLGVLCALGDHGAMSMSEVCRITAIDLATMRGVTERLKARHLVSALADSVDRRKVIVTLTSSGERLLSETIPAAQLVSELTVANLNPAEQMALQYLLRKLADGSDAPPQAREDGGPREEVPLAQLPNGRRARAVRKVTVPRP
ncbi:MAG: MarR family transcriptional regulator [Comamonadaceae bacterium]|nr:MAG: MarR family transcriptional regulator [Comamonadaceae bacterium]